MDMISPCPKLQFFDDNGNPLSGGKLYTYTAGTTSPLATYTTPAGNVPNTNPIILNARGETSVYLAPLIYKFVLKDANDVEIWTVDNINGLDQATYDAVLAAFAASNGSSLVGYTLGVANTTATTVEAKLQRFIDVKDFGATGDGSTNDRAAIYNAVTYINSVGGGTIYFPEGTYKIDGVQTNVNTWGYDGIFQNVSEATEAQLVFENLNRIRFIFDGAVLQSTKTNGGITLAFDGCNNLYFESLNMVGQTTMTGTGVGVTGTNAVAIFSSVNPSSNITFHATKIANHYSGLFVNGSAISTIRATNICMSGATSIATGDYGIALHNNGDNFVAERVSSFEHARPVFIYGVSNAVININAYAMVSGFQSLVKTYSRNTENIRLKHTVYDRLNSQYRIGIQSQHNPAVQPVPCYVRNVWLDISEINCETSGPALNFDYYQNTTPQATCSNYIFDNIILSGYTPTYNVTSTVTLSVNYPCQIMATNFQCQTGINGLNNKGFVGAQKFTYSPSIKFNGNATGATYAGQIGEYYIVNGLCYVNGAITLTNKGSSTGAVTVSMPIYPRTDTTVAHLFSAIGSNMSGLTKTLIGYVPSAGGLDAPLGEQGAINFAAITDTNVTNTSVITFAVVYPV